VTRISPPSASVNPAPPSAAVDAESSRSVIKLPGRASATAIIAALVIMCGAGLLRRSWMPPTLAMPSFGPPWEITTLVSPRPIYVALWAGGALAAAGVIGGLVAARRGLPIPLRTLLVAAGLCALVMTALPPFGSTDTLDYSIYGHIAALGRSPYVMTPLQYRNLVHLTTSVPHDWIRDPSVYGPLGTAEQLLAAKLGGALLVRDAFWLKVFNLLAFAGIAYAADRLNRGRPTDRVRVHLLWTVNPFILWGLIAGGHVDVIACAVGLAGLLVVDRRLISRPLVCAFAAGACVGAAVDIKAVFALYGAGVAWALLRKPSQLLAAGAGAAVILVPSYAVAGERAIKAITTRASVGYGYGFYGYIFNHIGISLKDAVPAAIVLLLPVGLLALARFPEAGVRDRMAVRAALALSIAWLLVWPHQFAWYSVMAICLLLFFPASRLDWISLAWLAALTIADMPGVGTNQKWRVGEALLQVQYNLLVRVAPLVMLACLIALVYCCVTQNWRGPQLVYVGAS
jgi:hypothetical protein